MRREQNILLVADESSLMKIYDFAKLIKTVSSINNPMLKVMAFTQLQPAFSIGKIFGNKKIDRNVILSDIQQLLGLGANVSHMLLSEASNVSLGMGEVPKNNCFYISHPIKEDIYIPLQDYNKLLAKEKNNVFMELAAALGAKSIHLEDANFYNNEGKLETEFSSFKPLAMNIGINANFEKDGSIKREVYSSFDKPRRTPMIPPHLQKWVDIDSDLGLMATHRLNNGLLSHQINLQFNDSLAGAAEVAANIPGINEGVRFKTSASKHISSTWVFRVEYYSIYDE
ncbi:hypothetical protein [Psychrobacter sp. JCM 18900]|uniref:hypothetical protein n=1 Tax=Psychrobacter sp. JCM 18900 TaxID=1298608 RepID=UPI00191AA52B|nr:hypothetical protein [Psychrobacter sp. JCM 18900]